MHNPLDTTLSSSQAEEVPYSVGGSEGGCIHSGIAPAMLLVELVLYRVGEACLHHFLGWKSPWPGVISGQGPGFGCLTKKAISHSLLCF